MSLAEGNDAEEESDSSQGLDDYDESGEMEGSTLASVAAQVSYNFV